ncbi:MAG: hypothetical protein K2M20_13620 [Lachnospiraceae bacterium]|nr:hypothetical protein [Lachnospiraceae bacterium]
MYQKEIIYLGLYKDGDRLGSAGFLKVEKRDRDGNLSLMVKNVPHSINGKYPVRYFNGLDWKEEDGITVQEGGGRWEKQESDSLAQVRLQIMLPGGYLVEGASKEAVRQTPAAKVEEKSGRTANAEPIAETGRDLREEAAVMGPVMLLPEEAAALETVVSQPERYTAAETDAEPPAFVREQDATAERPAVAEPPASVRGQDATAERPAAVEPVAAQRKSAVPQEAPQKVERIVVQKQGVRGRGEASVRTQKPLMADAFVIEGLKEDKWEQILDTYDNIHPYGDGRVYVKLEPKDFIILSGKYQHLVNNSFLLHGFYNYRHVILGKEGEGYYLGVPGVFYEREKMVALMFGFEAFECESGEAKAGEFGYYLRKVEL